MIENFSQFKERILSKFSFAEDEMAVLRKSLELGEAAEALWLNDFESQLDACCAETGDIEEVELLVRRIAKQSVAEAFLTAAIEIEQLK